MVDLALIFPYFNDDASFFKFPPLGLGYLASYCRQNGYSVGIVDCTFLTWEQAVSKVRQMRPRVVGVQSMLSMKNAALRFARELKDDCELLIAGGPQPTVYPEKFADDFDLVVLGEGEQTTLEVLSALDSGRSFNSIDGLAFRRQSETSMQAGRLRLATIQQSELTLTAPRKRIRELDSIPFPARDLYDHTQYKEYYMRNYGFTMTQMMCSRGCPFSCDFCSRPVFGRAYTARSSKNIVDEMEEILSYGYDRIWLSDDIFPIDRKMVVQVCEEIIRRGLKFEWGCLCRADLMNRELAEKMRQAGCWQIFFGLESGDDHVLKLMNKGITVQQSRIAVKACADAGIRVGAFFILGYPGETNETMLKTIRLATSLPLTYFSFTVPYPIPGTKLYEKVYHRMQTDEWNKPRNTSVDQKLIWASDHSERKLKFGISKARLQAKMRRRLGHAYYLTGWPFEKVTDTVFKFMS
jgi:anaerobic magnesium-protoporphyrin IX monomethyl ester cyclase